MSEPIFEAVWPEAPAVANTIAGLRKLDSVAGSHIAFIWDDLFRGQDIFDEFQAEAERRGQTFTTIPWEVFGDIHGHTDEHEVLARMPKLLAEYNVDAAIVGVGACGSCTPAVMRAAEAVEAAGVPTFALVASGFMRQAKSIGRSLGIKHTWIAEYPGVIPNDTDEVFLQKTRDVVVPSLFEGFDRLTAGFRIDDAAAPVAEPAPRDIVVSGTLDEVQDFFDERLWSDGLPVVPPTLERVDRFMEFTDRKADEVIGVILPASREATVWSVAVNGVMAGCKPEYMPILLGIVEVITDPNWRIEDAGCTPGWEPLVVVSGPLVKALDFNYQGGMMRVGRRANTSIGRFVRMYMRNVAGLLTEPGDTDKAAIGRTFNVALAENDDLTIGAGWNPDRVDAGFSLTDTVVSVQSVVGISGPAYTGGTPEDQLEVLTRFAKDTIGGWGFTHILFHASSTLLLMSPSVAASFAQEGYSKSDIRKYLANNVKVEADLMEKFGTMTRGNPYTFKEMVDARRIPEHFAESDDPSRLLPVIADEHEVRIVVAGDPGRNQNRFYANNHAQGLPQYRRVEVNAALAELIG
jgi:hypothetical protein